MTSPVLVPADGIEPALDALRADARVATVSFLANSAGHLSFPHRNGPTAYAITGHDETTLHPPAARSAAGWRRADHGPGRRRAGRPACVTMSGGPQLFDLQPGVSLIDSCYARSGAGSSRCLTR